MIGARRAILLSGQKVRWPALKAARAAAASNPQTTGAMTSPPTIAVSASSQSATFPTNYPSTQTQAGFDAAFDVANGKDIYGSTRAQTYSLSVSGNTSNWATTAGLASTVQRYRFIHTGTDFCMIITDSTIAGINSFRLIVNGQYATREGNQTLGLNTSNNYITVTFSSSATRDIIVEVPAPVKFAGLQIRNTDTCSKPSINVPKILYVWDSFGTAINNPTTGVTATAGQNLYYADNLAVRAADYLGCKAILDCRGSTGFLAGTVGSGRYKDRLLPAGGNDLANLTYDAIVILASGNDARLIFQGTNTRTDFQNEVNSTIPAIAAAYPNVPTVVSSQWYFPGAGATINANMPIDMQAAVAAAKTATPNAKIGYIDCSNIVNAGNYTTWLNSSDNTHPMTVGEVALSPIFANLIYNCLQSIA